MNWILINDNSVLREFHETPEWPLVCNNFYMEMCSKPLRGSKVDSAFHPSEVDKMSTRNIWEPSGKK